MYHKIMDETHSDIDNPAGIASIDKLYGEIKMVEIKITKNDAKFRGKIHTLCIKYQQENFRNVNIDL